MILLERNSNKVSFNHKNEQISDKMVELTEKQLISIIKKAYIRGVVDVRVNLIGKPMSEKERYLGASWVNKRMKDLIEEVVSL